jgi:hypothetical protein
MFIYHLLPHEIVIFMKARVMSALFPKVLSLLGIVSEDMTGTPQTSGGRKSGIEKKEEISRKKRAA